MQNLSLLMLHVCMYVCVAITTRPKLPQPLQVGRPDGCVVGAMQMHYAYSLLAVLRRDPIDHLYGIPTSSRHSLPSSTKIDDVTIRWPESHCGRRCLVVRCLVVRAFVSSFFECVRWCVRCLCGAFFVCLFVCLFVRLFVCAVCSLFVAALLVAVLP